MADFYMYIGLPGSGKSTAAAAQKGATIISSDAIRGELYHDGSIIEHVYRVQKAVHTLLYAEDNSRFPDEDTKNLVYPILRSVATWHDVGKPFVKSFFNARQEFTPKEAHYYTIS